MAYSSARRCFEANIREMSSRDVQTDVASNLSKGLSELTATLAVDIQDLRTQLEAIRKELDQLKVERRHLLI
jgi:hypothetical protein